MSSISIPSTGGGSVTPADGFEGYLSGNTYKPYDGPSMAAATSAPAPTSTYFIPFSVLEDITIDQLGIYVSTLFSGGNSQVAIYANNKANAGGRPTGTPLAKTGNLSTTAAGVVMASLLDAAGSALPSLLLERGKIYWLGCQGDNTTWRTQTLASTSALVSAIIGSPTPGDLSGGAGGSAQQIMIAGTTFGTWPNATSATFTIDTTYRAAVPHLRKA